MVGGRLTLIVFSGFEPDVLEQATKGTVLNALPVIPKLGPEHKTNNKVPAKKDEAEQRYFPVKAIIHAPKFEED